MRPDELQLGFLKVLYGAYMYEDAKQYGIVYTSYPPYEVLYTQWLSYEDILELKRVEDVLEIYYGSGQFMYSIRYLESFFTTPYEFYSKLGEFYAHSHICGSKHSRIERYNVLLKFARRCSHIDINESVLAELMTLDIYLRENIKSRPSFARTIEECREQIKEVARLNNISKNKHIEIFSQETTRYAKEILGLSDCDIYVSFDYDSRNPVTYNATVKILKNF